MIKIIERDDTVKITDSTRWWHGVVKLDRDKNTICLFEPVEMSLCMSLFV